MDFYLHVISLLSSLVAKWCTLTWEFQGITRFYNVEVIVNRIKYLNLLWRLNVTEAGKLLQWYMDANKSCKEDSRQDEIRHRNGCKRIIWRGKLVFNLRDVEGREQEKIRESAEFLFEELCGLQSGDGN